MTLERFAVWCAVATVVVVVIWAGRGISRMLKQPLRCSRCHREQSEADLVYEMHGSYVADLCRPGVGCQAPDRRAEALARIKRETSYQRGLGVRIVPADNRIYDTVRTSLRGGTGHVNGTRVGGKDAA